MAKVLRQKMERTCEETEEGEKDKGSDGEVDYVGVVHFPFAVLFP
jgi:hypothetical protein